MSEFTATFFTANRKALAQKTRGGVLVVTAYDRVQQKADMTAPFRQESNFWYVSGITEPSWRLVYEPAGDKTWLVQPERSEVEIIFDGDVDESALLRASGAQEIVAERDFDALLRRLAKTHPNVYTVKPDTTMTGFALNPAPRQLVRRLERIFTSVHDARRQLAELRAIKQPAEIKAIKTAVAHTAEAFQHIMAHRDDYSYEYEIEADFWRTFRRHNAQHAYEPIVANAAQANTLHYTANNQKIKPNTCTLMDCGATCGEYGADITRTICHGTPTNDQRRIYETLVGAHKQIIAYIRPGVALREYLEYVDTTMKQALCDCGLLDNMQNDVHYRRLLPHAISHGLGVDVHDTLGGFAEFRAGMVLTVEPGIYSAELGIGMRVEDDILVTDDGHENMSQKIPLSLS